jgi:hypothetical protein
MDFKVLKFVNSFTEKELTDRRLFERPSLMVQGTPYLISIAKTIYVFELVEESK